MWRIFLLVCYYKFADDGTLSETVYKAATSSLQNEADATIRGLLQITFSLTRSNVNN